MNLVVIVPLLFLSLHYFVKKSKEDVLQPIVLYIFLYYVFGHIFRLLLLLAFPFDLGNFSLRTLVWDNDLASKTLLISLLSLVGIILGYEIAIAAPIITWRRLASEPRPTRTILTISMLFSLIYYWFSNSVKATSEVLIFGSSSVKFNFVILLMLFTLEVSFREKSKTLMSLSIFALVVIVMRAFLNAWKGDLIIVLQVWLLFQYLKYGSVKLVKAVTIVFLLAVVLVMFVYPLISTYRSRIALNQDIALVSIVSETYRDNTVVDLMIDGLRYLSARFQYFDEEYVVVSMSNEERIAYNNEVVDPVFALFSFLFPRIVFPDKPIITTGRSNAIIVAAIPRYIYTNIAISFVGDLYLRTGIFGVLFWSSIYGFILGLSYNLFKNGRFRPFFYFWLLVELNFSEGDLFARLSGLIMNLIILTIIYRFLGLIMGKRRHICGNSNSIEQCSLEENL